MAGTRDRGRRSPCQLFSGDAERSPARCRARARRHRLLHRPDARAISAGSIPRPARTRTSRSARARRRTASSSGPTARPGSPTAGSTPSCASIPPTKKFTYFMLPPQLPSANLNTGVFDKDGVLLVHRPERRARPVNPKTGKLESWKSPRGGSLRHHGDARQRCLVRGARGRSSRQDRQGDRQRRRSSSRRRSAHGPAPRLVGFQGHAVGELLAFRRGRPLRSGDEDCGRCIAMPRQSAAPMPSMSTRRTRSGRPTFANAILRFDPATETFETFPSDKRGAQVRQMLGPAGRGLGRRIRQRPAGGDQVLTPRAGIKPPPPCPSAAPRRCSLPSIDW